MQSNIVKAFRQRLVRGGFSTISIWERSDGSYFLDCFAPRTFEKISLVLTETQMQNIPRTVWFENFSEGSQNSDPYTM